MKKFLCVLCVHICACVAVAEERECAIYQIFFFPVCLHIHVECVDMLFSALSLWNALLMHNSMHALHTGTNWPSPGMTMP